MALSRPGFLWLLLFLIPFAAAEARRMSRLLPGMKALWGEAAAASWLRASIISRAAGAIAALLFIIALCGPL